MDMAMVKMGVDAVIGLSNAYYANKIGEIQANAANTIRAGNNSVIAKANERNASITKLQRWRQEVSNSRVYETVGNNQEALVTNFNRARDQRTRANFSDSIRSAEELGRQQASAAHSGVTGSVVDMIDSTTRIKQGMERVNKESTERQVGSDFEKRQFWQRTSTLDSLDYSAIYDNVILQDTTIDIPNKQGLLGAAIMGGLGKDGKNLKNVAATFNFNTKSDPISDFYLHGNRGAGD